MNRLLAFPAAAFALALAAGPAAAATSPSRTFTVVSGEVRLRGDEQVCFRLSDDRMASDRILVRLRFTGRVPDGRIELDGAVSERFSRASEEVPFVIDPRGTHRLKLDLPSGTTVDSLTITSTESTVIRETCSTYELEQSRTVRIDTPAEEPTSAFETPEERREREEREARDRAAYPTGPTGPTGPTAPAPAHVGTASSAGGRVPAGTEMSLTLQSGIDTRNAYAGQLFTAYLDHDIIENGRVVIPEGSRIEGHVIESKDAGRFGRSSLKLGFDKVILPDGRTATMSASVSRVGKGSAKKQGGIIAGSAVGGAILGKILGGDDKDALLGAIVGGAIAAGSIGAKEGESIVLPAGTAVTVNTDSTVDVPAKR
jgi:hypothetical protein